MSKREVQIIIRDSEGEEINNVMAEDFIELKYMLGIATGEIRQYVMTQESNSKFCKDLYDIGEKIAKD